ncbi:hypothetical protein Q5P01_004381 [Channa striata]|uniref:Uncharacterized protein n=1 Tax=Channa striata TaxID=64152 RepID=A0AA88NP51_CHASR|nr:hypothetical protein Q5P01_004381 [Channa striata]
MSRVSDGKHSREEGGQGGAEELQEDEEEAAPTPHARPECLHDALPGGGSSSSGQRRQREGGASVPLCQPHQELLPPLTFSRPSSPRSAPAGTSGSKMSPSSSKTIFPYQTGPPQEDSPPKSPHRLSFSGIFRSASRDSNHQPSLSPVSIKLFTRNKRDKARVQLHPSPLASAVEQGRLCGHL